MPYVLHHTATGQIYACLLRNGYDLVYYGVKYWEDEEAASTELPAFHASQELLATEAWSLLEIEEQVLKLCNVKLKNNPKYICFLDTEGRPYTEVLTP
ncbi:hypothetical protein [Paenibacillus guangzhouensis]|uniref:hypothetical protein n=1 Tax=Paenibacillus guangzhouensis TaxID=1473112 RepID=UPI001267611C|nr:hypothetical protein [Paenibacillus guangzhouensis]